MTMFLSASADNYVDPLHVTRWMELFGYDGPEAMATIRGHRRNIAVHVSKEQWKWVRWGHEKAGYNKEAYEHLLVLKQLARKEKRARDNGHRLCEWVGDYSRICLEGCLCLATLGRIIGDENIGTVHPEEKWCFIKHNRKHEKQILAWVTRTERAVARGMKSYSKAWEAATAEKKGSTMPERAGFHSVPPSSRIDSNAMDIQVRFVRLGHDEADITSVQDVSRPRYVWGPVVNRLRLEHSMAELSSLQPSQPLRFSPLLQWPSSSSSSALAPVNLVGMNFFLQQYRTDPHIHLPVFGNAPRVFPLPGEFITRSRAQSIASNPRSSRVDAIDTAESAPQASQNQLEHHLTTNRRSAPHDRRLVRSHERRRRNASLNQTTIGRSRAHQMEARFGESVPQSVCDMEIREIIVLNAIEAVESTNQRSSRIDNNSTPAEPEIWRQYYLSPIQNLSPADIGQRTTCPSDAGTKNSHC